MCGRYSLDDSIDKKDLQEIIAAVNRRVSARPVKTSGEVAPADTVPVIASSRARTPAVFPMTWGYTLDGGRRIINARSEAAAEKPLFRDGMRQRRCVVPAGCYYEWERSGKERTKYAIRPEAEGLTYLAGIYRLEEEQPVFVILTRDPAESISFIHNRMPVLLPRRLVDAWIDPGCSPDELLRSAVLDVRGRRVDAPAPEQLRMEL